MLDSRLSLHWRLVKFSEGTEKRGDNLQKKQKVLALDWRASILVRGLLAWEGP